jgi:macrodomain Ter protein organizer (MatP/YcbG family)
MKDKTIGKLINLKQSVWDDLDKLSKQEDTTVTQQVKEAVKDRLKKKLKNN